MNKKILAIIIVLVLLCTFAIIRISTFTNENKHQENQIITAQEAEKLCFAVMGEKDKETGFPFSFGVTSTIEQNGKQYYVIRASWLVNNSHLSYIGDFFVSSDGREIYTGTALAGEYEITDKIWSK